MAARVQVTDSNGNPIFTAREVNQNYNPNAACNFNVVSISWANGINPDNCPNNGVISVDGAPGRPVQLLNHIAGVNPGADQMNCQC